MTAPVAREITSHSPDGRPRLREVVTYCPGCENVHPFTVEVLDGTSHPVWQWDGNLERPTFSPSMLVHGAVHVCKAEHPPQVCDDPEGCGEPGHLILSEDEDGNRVLGHNTPHTRSPAFGVCHSFLRAGRWEFLSDCAHPLAGQQVDMVPLPDHWVAK